MKTRQSHCNSSALTVPKKERFETFEAETHSQGNKSIKPGEFQWCWTYTPDVWDLTTPAISSSGAWRRASTTASSFKSLAGGAKSGRLCGTQNNQTQVVLNGSPIELFARNLYHLSYVDHDSWCPNPRHLLSLKRPLLVQPGLQCFSLASQRPSRRPSPILFSTTSLHGFTFGSLDFWGCFGSSDSGGSRSVNPAAVSFKNSSFALSSDAATFLADAAARLARCLRRLTCALVSSRGSSNFWAITFSGIGTQPSRSTVAPAPCRRLLLDALATLFSKSICCAIFAVSSACCKARRLATSSWTAKARARCTRASCHSSSQPGSQPLTSSYHTTTLQKSIL